MEITPITDYWNSRLKNMWMKATLRVGSQGQGEEKVHEKVTKAL